MHRKRVAQLLKAALGQHTVLTGNTTGVGVQALTVDGVMVLALVGHPMVLARVLAMVQALAQDPARAPVMDLVAVVLVRDLGLEVAVVPLVMDMGLEVVPDIHPMGEVHET